MAENIEENKNREINEGWNKHRDILSWVNRIFHRVDNVKKQEVIEAQDQARNSTENLGKLTVDQALDDLQANVEKWLDIQESNDSAKKELNDFFEKWKEDYEKNEKMANDFVDNYNTLKNRNKDIAQSIKSSANYVQLEIDSWDSEPNYVARSLLRIVKWIMNTEK